MKLGKGKELFFVFFLFTIFSLLIFWPIFLGKVNLNGNLLVSFYPIFGKNLPYKNIIGLDQLRLYFPNYTLVIDQLKNFNIPHWNPYIFAGNLNIASLQSAVFYPFNVFGLIMPQLEFWHLLRISPLVLGSFFMFIYLRNLKLSILAAFFGGLSFGFSPFILTWGEEQVITPHTIIWLPLVLYCVDKLIEIDTVKRILFRKFCFLAISFSVAFSVFAGFIQLSIYMLVVAILYSIFRLGQSRAKVKFGIIIFGSMVVGLLISAIQILPTVELYLLSARAVVASHGILNSFLLPPEALLTYLAPDFFGNPANWNFFRGGISTYYESVMFIGTSALLFALYEIWEGRRESLSKFYFLLGFGALVLTLDSPIAKLFLLLPVPVLSTSIANRLLFISTFCFVVLASFGLNRWLLARDKKILKYISFLGSLYFFVALYLFGVKVFGWSYIASGGLGEAETLRITLRNLVLPIGFFVLISFVVIIACLKRFAGKKNIIATLIILFACLELFFFCRKYFSFTNRVNVFPEIAPIAYVQKNQGFFRSWGIGQANLENNFSSQYKIYSPEGYDSLNILSYAEFTEAMQHGSLGDVSFRADAGIGRGMTVELLTNVNRRKLIDMIGVRFVIAESIDFELLEVFNFVKVFDEGTNQLGKHFAVFENTQVLPRVFLASNYEGPPNVATINKTEGQIKEERRRLIPQKLLSSGFDWRNVLVLEEPSPISPQFGPGTAEIFSYKNNEVIIKTQSDQPKLLFLSDNYYPGWKVKIDGEEGKILRANYTFRAVPLIAGEHVVRFYYDSQTFKIGLYLSILGLLSLVIYLIYKNSTLLPKIFPKRE